MQFRNLGESLNATKSIEKVLGNISISSELEILSKTTQKLSVNLKNYSLETIKAATSQMSLSKEQLYAVFAAKGLTGAELDSTVATVAMDAAQKSAALSTAGLANAAKGLWATLSSNTLFWVASALTVAVSAFSMYKQSQEESRQAAADAAQEYANTAASIDDYKSRYQDLHTALLEAKGNEEETYNVKQQLLDLQNELNDKYGEEYGRINLLSDAYRDHTEAIKSYNREAAQKALNEIGAIKAVIQ